MAVGSVLPFAAHVAVQLLGEMKPEEDISRIGVKLNEPAINKGIKAGNVRAHAVGWDGIRGKAERERLPIQSTVIMNALIIESQGALAAYL